jgi:hypothetical protein
LTGSFSCNKINNVWLIEFRFIGPFLKTVQKWEKTLALISEIIDEWCTTQRKWLYLEGIFVGGDIRSQLPEEARKFDDIDRTFRKVRQHINFLTQMCDCYT